MGGRKLHANLSKFLVREQVSKYIHFRGDADRDKDEVVLETEAEDLVKQGLCERVVGTTAAQAKLDILVVDMYHEVRSHRFQDAGQECPDAVQDCQSLEKSVVLSMVPVGNVMEKTSCW